MSIKISDLPAATSIAAADLLCIVQGADTKKAAVSLLPQPASFLPGMVQMFAGAAAPTGWLLCNGAAVSRSTYSALFAAIGTTYGAGDGTTTFTLPDVRGRSPLGAGAGAGLTARTLGATGGEESHSLTAAENGPHTHSGYWWAATGGAVLQGGVTYAAGGGGVIPLSGNGTLHNTMHPFLVLNFIIKI
jgi:microcystin-dependent protein